MVATQPLCAAPSTLATSQLCTCTHSLTPFTHSRRNIPLSFFLRASQSSLQFAAMAATVACALAHGNKQVFPVNPELGVPGFPDCVNPSIALGAPTTTTLTLWPPQSHLALFWP